MQPSDRFFVWCFESERELAGFAERFRAFLDTPTGRRYLAGPGGVEAWAHAEPGNHAWCVYLFANAAAAQAAAAAGLEERRARALDAVRRDELPAERWQVIGPNDGSNVGPGEPNDG